MNAKQPKLKSTTSGFENIGKFYLHILKKTEELKLNPYDLSIYMFLVRNSFGYVNNIQYELKISTRQISEALNISTGKASTTLKKLIDLGLVNRIKWQDVGPKQTYKYSVVFPQGFHITTKNNTIDESGSRISEYNLSESVIKKINSFETKTDLDKMIHAMNNSRQKPTELETKNMYAYFNKSKPIREDVSLNSIL